jgi:benzoate-CoA ligase family protein
MGEMAIEIDGEGIPQLQFPEPFNVAEVFIDRHLAEGRAGKVAIRTLQREVTYADLVRNVNRFGNTLIKLGIGRGERVLMVVKDCPEFFFLFWGAIKAGVIPVPLNTMLRAKDFDYIIRDSECTGLVYSLEFGSEVELAFAQCAWKPRVVLRMQGDDEALASRARDATPELRALPACASEDCFWLYSSGTTGLPKGVVHAHGDIVVTCQHFFAATLGAEEEDVFFSVPRLFFSYGMGIAMNAPLWFGATAILDDRRPTPQTVTEIFRRFAPTVFAAVPTFYAALLASGVLQKNDVTRLRRCLSGGEATPPDVQRRWLELTGVPTLEVIGSTEMLFIYISNRIDDIRPGTTGKPVLGYQVRIVDDEGRDIADGAPGRLLVKGQSVMKRYWNNPEKTARTLADGWLDSGDTFYRNQDGYYVYCGRSDDMFKVGARWISPFEIESTLIEHPKVLEAAVVGRPDEWGLFKAEAWVVLKNSADASDTTAEEIRAFCKSKLAPYKYPQWITFADQLPKTATGKIQRFKLRTSPHEPLPT